MCSLLKPDYYLCWDIDGTLLTTARGGVYSLIRATREVTGTELNLSGFVTAGLTDVEITRLIISKVAPPATQEKVKDFLKIYEDDLPKSLHRKQGQVFQGVIPILDFLQRTNRVRSILLTGNTARGAKAKLVHYGLAKYFEMGAFSDDTETRADVARRALQLIRDESPNFPSNRIFVIGDTIHDIRCAQAIGVRSIGVGTGGAAIEELESVGADAVIPELPKPKHFISLLDRLLATT